MLKLAESLCGVVCAQIAHKRLDVPVRRRGEVVLRCHAAAAPIRARPGAAGGWAVCALAGRQSWRLGQSAQLCLLAMKKGGSRMAKIPQSRAAL